MSLESDDKKAGEKHSLLNSRRRAREAAVQALYQCDTLGDCSEQAIEFFFDHFHPGCRLSEENAVKENTAFALRLVRGVLANLGPVDSFISTASVHWSVGRMARVDRNILRIGAYEIGFVEEIPVSVTINEAIEIAKRFGCPDSPTFVNGVLDNIAKAVLDSESQVAKTKRTGTAG